MSSKDTYNVTQPEQQSRLRRFCNVFYDSEKGQFLGRNASSWGKITLFYVIYYGFLAGFFAMWLAIFVETLDYYEPRFHGEGSILGSTPGMNFRPHPDNAKNLIWFSSAKPFTYKPYVDDLQKFLNDYEPKDAEWTANKCDNGTAPEGKACFFDHNDEFRELEDCQLKKEFGYKDGAPCVVVFINKVYGWTPEPYEREKDAPKIVQEKGYSREHISVICEGLHATDTEHVGPVEYRPKEGFSRSFYPYLTIPHYLQPLVMVQFKGVHTGVLINVVCKMYAKNVEHNIEEQVGLTRFELMVE